jgi:hypothetical protein
VRQPRGDQLGRAQLVVDALAHARAKLGETDRRLGAGILPDVAVAPERGVAVGERADECARVRH